jgi:tetratricopeptide (TPR) repeat protein
MDLLKQSMGDSPTGRQRLTATYVGLARDLQNQLEITPPAARVGLAQGFDAFLSEVNQSATEFNVKNWIAETYYKLGEALELDGNPTPEAKQYFAKSGDAYKKMLDAAEGGEIKLNPAMAIQMRMRRAGTMRRLGAFERATDEFDQILRARNNMLNVQIEAAQTLKAHGIAGDAKLFNDAIKGARRNANTGKNTIWGWSRIARVAQSQMQRSPEQREKFGATFFDAQYQYAECRFLQAMKSSGEAKKKYLGSASNVIGYTASSFPDFGGDEGRARFDQLMKKIQKASGTEPVGLGAKK